MKRRCDWLSAVGFCVMYAVVMALVPGCNSQTTTPVATNAGSGSATGHHDEQDHGHDAKHDHKGHHHAEHGPHKGTLVVLHNHEYHLELVLDAETGKLTGYVLDSDADEAVAIKQQEIALSIAPAGEKKDDLADLFEMKLAAVNPTDAGEASEFAGESEKLKGVKEFEAVLTSITLKGEEVKDVKFNFPKGNEDHH